jgi:hypothetical protein
LCGTTIVAIARMGKLVATIEVVRRTFFFFFFKKIMFFGSSNYGKTCVSNSYYRERRY